jgi:hypothetical protein
MEMMSFAAIWTPHDVTWHLMMVFSLLSLIDDDMWPLEAFSMPLRASRHHTCDHILYYFHVLTFVEAILRGRPTFGICR